MLIRRMPVGRIALSLALPALVSACNSDHATQPDETDPQIPLITTLLVSAPSTLNAAGQSLLSIGASGENTYTFISAPPGSALGETASITNKTRDRKTGTTTSVDAPIQDGGFDPVLVAASPGDTLQIQFLSADRSAVLVGAAVVPSKRPPTVVRTNPSPGKKDVPLNMRLEIVFSEPIDPATLTPANVQVIAGGVRVTGSLERANDFTVDFIPAEPLRPNSSFQIVVSTGVRNLGGVSLENEFKSDFETAAASDPSPIGCSSGIECLAFVRDGSIFTSDIVSSETVLISQGIRPSWSPDRTRIAFVRPVGNALAPWQLCIENPGAEIRCASDGLNGVTVGKPSWSPDGSKIAFSVFYYSCPNGNCGQWGGYFSSLLILNTATMQITRLETPMVTSASWSPDGRKIALVLFNVGIHGRGALATVNPDGSDLNYLTTPLGSYSVVEAEWSPDASRLALTLNDENACPWYCDTAVGVVNADGAQLKVLDKAYTCFGRDCTGKETYITGSPEWVGNGDRVAYTVTTGECYLDERASCGTNVMFANVNDGHIGVLLSGGGYPSWRR